MAKYALPLSGIATSGSAGSYKTIAALDAGASGHCGKLQAINIACQDNQVDDSLRVRVVRGNRDGTGTSTSDTPLKKDSRSRASGMTAGNDFSVEPTTLGDPIFQTAFNGRSTLRIEFPPGREIEWQGGEQLCIQVAPDTANARTLEGAIEWEE
jgi:hypothetical protein